MHGFLTAVDPLPSNDSPAPTFGRWRRLSKDYEYLTDTSENAIYLAMSLILTRRTAKATT